MHGIHCMYYTYFAESCFFRQDLNDMNFSSTLNPCNVCVCVYVFVCHGEIRRRERDIENDRQKAIETLTTRWQQNIQIQLLPPMWTAKHLLEKSRQRSQLKHSKGIHVSTVKQHMKTTFVYISYNQALSNTQGCPKISQLIGRKNDPSIIFIESSNFLMSLLSFDQFHMVPSWVSVLLLTAPLSPCPTTVSCLGRLHIKNVGDR